MGAAEPMAAMFEQGKLVGLICTAVGLLFVIIGLIGPLQGYTSSSTMNGITITLEVSFTIKEMTLKSSATGISPVEESMDIWDASCTEDSCKAGVSMSKAGFSMLLIGILVCCVLLASFVAAGGYVAEYVALPSPLGEQVPTTGIGAVAVFFLLVGVICGVHYPVKTFEDARSPPDLSVAWGGFMLIIGFISITVAAAMAYVGIDPEASVEASSTAEAPAGIVAVDVEAGAQPAQQQIPEGHYEKNGQLIPMGNDGPGQA